MGYRAVGRRMSPPGSKQHEHITELLLRPDTGVGNDEWWARSKVVSYLRNLPGSIYTQDQFGIAYVVVVDANPPYVRTVKDRRYTDNLLYLPEYPAYVATR